MIVMEEQVSRLEKRVDKLETDIGGLRSTIADLKVTLALLNQTLNQLRQVEEKRNAAKDRTLMFVVGGFITAIIAWIVRGGFRGMIKKVPITRRFPSFLVGGDC